MIKNIRIFSIKQKIVNGSENFFCWKLTILKTNETRLLMNVWIKSNEILVCYRSVWTNEWVNEGIDGKLNHDWPSKWAAKPLATSAISWLVEDREIFRSDPSVFLKENKTKDLSVFLKQNPICFENTSKVGVFFCLMN